MKYLAIAILTISLFLPSTSAFAAFTLENSYANSIIENAQHAESVEFELDADILVKQLSNGYQLFQGDTSVHGVATGLQSGKEEVAIDATYNSQIDGSANSDSIKVFLTRSRFYYFDNTDSEWYFMDLVDTSEYQQISSELENASDDFPIDAFVITNQLDNVLVNGQEISRFAYTVDADKLIDQYNEMNEFPPGDLVVMNDEPIKPEVQFSGEIWVNFETMLPYKITMNGTIVDEESDLDIAVNLELTFVSFNENPFIMEPNDAIDSMAQFRDDDSDGLTNGQEIVYGSDPNNPDTDGDGFIDGIEVRNGYNPISTGQLDSDNDSLGDHDEMVLWHTNRYRADSDYDGYDDAVEIRYLHNPNGTGALDADRDGVSDHDEMFVWHTNRFKSDTDGDGYSDATEIRYGYNPNGPGRA